MELRQLQDLLADALPSFLAARKLQKKPVPWVAENDIRLFITCGDPQYGYAELVCPTCPFKRILASSCKRRSMCPRCIRRRQLERVRHIVDNVLAGLPVRHWVLTLPLALRFVLAYCPALMAGIQTCFVDAIFLYLRHKAKRELGLRRVSMARPGAIGVPHRVSANLYTNPHFHIAVPEGVHVLSNPGEPTTFHLLSPPTPEEIAAVTSRASARILKLLVRKKFKQPIDELDAHSFDVFARDFVQPDDRDGLERLILYLLAPPFTEDQLKLHADGRLLLTLKRPRHNGCTEEWFTIHEFLAALIPLVPEPRSHSLRYHGNLSRHSSIRKHTVRDNKRHERRPTTPENESVSEREAMIQLNVTSHREDFLRCPVCLSRLQLAALVTQKITYRNPRWIAPDTPIHEIKRHSRQDLAQPIKPMNQGVQLSLFPANRT